LRVFYNLNIIKIFYFNEIIFNKVIKSEILKKYNKCQYQSVKNVKIISIDLSILIEKVKYIM